MDWKDFVINSAIATIIQLAKAGEGKGKWRPALMKIFRTIAQQVATEAEMRELLKPDGGKV